MDNRSYAFEYSGCALFTEVSCIIVPEDISVEDATIKRAVQEGVVILGTSMTAYEVCCKAYELMKSEG